MRLIGKLLALPFMLVTGILYLVCKFLVVLSGAVLGILSGIIFLAALVLFFVAGFLPGLAWLMIAFLISPYGLPLAAAWLVGIIGGTNSALKDFIFAVITESIKCCCFFWLTWGQRGINHLYVRFLPACLFCYTTENVVN